MGHNQAGYNGEAAPRVCVPANEVSEFIELLGGIVSPKIYTNMVARILMVFKITTFDNWDRA